MRTNIAIPKELSEELDKWCELYGIKKYWLITTAIRHALAFPTTVWNIKENKFIKEDK